MAQEQIQPPDDEFGLSEEEFRLSQERRQQEIMADSSREFEKKARLYFVFRSAEQRDAAMKFINQMRDNRKGFDENFRYFEDCSIDSARKDIGIEIRFSKNPKHIREKFEKLLVEQGLAPGEEYETVDGKPEPDETRINPQ